MQVYIKNFLKIFLVFAIAACAREKHEGVVFDESELAKIKVGITKLEVESLIGSPSIEIPETKSELPSWVYVSAEKKWHAFFHPKVESQKVVEIQFKANIVSKIIFYTEEDIKNSNFKTEIKDYKKPIN